MSSTESILFERLQKPLEAFSKRLTAEQLRQLSGGTLPLEVCLAAGDVEVAWAVGFPSESPQPV